MFCNPIEDRESFQDIYMHADEQRRLQCAQEAPNPIDYSDAFAVAEGKIEGNNMEKNRKKRKKYISIMSYPPFCRIFSSRARIVETNRIG